MRKATKAQLKKWLDNQLKANKIMHERLKLGEHGTLSNYSASERGIHIGGESVRALAEIFGFELKATKWSDDPEYEYQVLFVYEGVIFFGIESADEYKEAGEIQ